jgi:hypothetical protein
MAPLEGSCLCGGVRFEVIEDFSAVRVCHCTTCKKLSGGVGTTNGRGRTDSIRILAGEELLRTYQPAEGTSKTFCSECGSNLFGGGWPKFEYTSVRLPTIDTHFDRKPEAHIFVRSAAPWEVLPDDGLERFEAGAK